MRPSALQLLATSAALLFGAGDALAQHTRVVGRVVDARSGQPIGAAQVTFGDMLPVQTERDGVFRVDRVEAGEHVVTVERPRQGSGQLRVLVPNRGEIAVELRVSLATHQLETLTVTARPISPRELRTRASGRRTDLITREDIERRGGAGNVGDMVRTFAGLTVRDGSLESCITTDAGNNLTRRDRMSACTGVLVVIDGVPIAGGSQMIRQMPLRDVESIEYLKSSEATSRYGGPGANGAIVIESRRPQDARMN